MRCYLIELRDQTFAKGYGFFIFAEHIGKIQVKNASKNFKSKYSQKLLDHAQQSATDALKTASRRPIQETAKPTNDLTYNKIADEITSTAS